VFLEENGHALTCTNDELEGLALAVARYDMEKSAVAEFIRADSSAAGLERLGGGCEAAWPVWSLVFGYSGQ